MNDNIDVLGAVMLGGMCAGMASTVLQSWLLVRGLKPTQPYAYALFAVVLLAFLGYVTYVALDVPSLLAALSNHRPDADLKTAIRTGFMATAWWFTASLLFVAHLAIQQRQRRIAVLEASCAP